MNVFVIIIIIIIIIVIVITITVIVVIITSVFVRILTEYFQCVATILCPAIRFVQITLQRNFREDQENG